MILPIFYMNFQSEFGRCSVIFDGYNTEDLEDTLTWAEEACFFYIRCLCDRTHTQIGSSHFLRSSLYFWDLPQSYNFRNMFALLSGKEQSKHVAEKFYISKVKPCCIYAGKVPIELIKANIYIPHI